MIENYLSHREIVALCGERSAMILNCIMSWVEYNKANGKSYKDGYYWSYNTFPAFKKEFPFWSERQIRYALDKLIKEGLIKTANYNSNCQRTLWYTYTQKALDIIHRNKETISQVPQIASESILEEQKTGKKEEIQQKMPEISNFEEKNEQNEPNSAKTQKCKYGMTNLSNRNDKNVNTELQNCKIGMTNLSDMNNKPQKTNLNNKLGLEKETSKEKESTKTQSLDSVCSQIQDFWNHQGLLFCDEITPRIKAIIKTALKVRTVEEILQSITNYATVLFSNNYFSHKYPLKSFLGPALEEFSNNGDKWRSYLAEASNSKTSPTSNNFIHNNYSKEQVEGFLTNLDEVEV